MTKRSMCTAVLLVVACLHLQSCHGSGTRSLQSGSSTSTRAMPADQAIPTNVSTGAERARTATLHLSDLPAGWKLQDPSEGLDLDIIWRDITRCMGVGTSDAGGGETSPTFLRGLATQAQATVEYTTDDRAGAIGNGLAGAQYQQCATAAFTDDVKRNAPEGGRPGPVTVLPLAVPRAGDRTFASRIRVDIGLDELKVPIYQDLVVIFARGAIIRFLFLNPGAAFPEDLEQALVANVIGRA